MTIFGKSIAGSTIFLVLMLIQITAIGLNIAGGLPIAWLNLVQSMGVCAVLYIEYLYSAQVEASVIDAAELDQQE